MKSSSLFHTATAFAVVFGLISTLAPISRADQILRWGHFWTANSNPAYNMNATGRREAHTVVPVRAMTISQIAVCGSTTRAGTPLYRIGVQGDDGTTAHYPDGQWIGGTENFATSAIPVNGWQTFTLPATAELLKGVRYHLVIEATSADATNYSSIIRNYQPTRRCFRVYDGVYDEAVGRETFSGTAWSRESSFPIVAIDTMANQAIGQPWTTGENTFGINKDWRYGQTFRLDIPTESASVELVEFSLYVSTINLAPADDLRVHLMKTGNTTPLLSLVLINKDSLPSIGIITVETLPIKLLRGNDYSFLVESTNTTDSGYYRISSVNGPKTTDFAQAAEATFQGSAGGCISSFRNAAWIPKLSGGGSATDLVFELKLRIPNPGTLMTVR